MKIVGEDRSAEVQFRCSRPVDRPSSFLLESCGSLMVRPHIGGLFMGDYQIGEV